MLSRHPTVDGGALVPRHVDLRAFASAAATTWRWPPAASRASVASAGALVVNSSQNGGGKDTWVLS